MEAHHKWALIRNNVMLVGQMVVSEILLEQLKSDGVVLLENAEELNGTKYGRESSANLVRLLHSCGSNAMKSFIKALIVSGQRTIALKLEPDIADQLEREGVKEIPHQNTEQQQQQQQTSEEQEQDMDIDLNPDLDIDDDDDDDTDSCIDVQVKPVNVNSITFKQQLKRKDVYAIQHKKRGRALIINNEIFHSQGQKKLKNREGTNFDMMNLDSLLVNLGYETQVHSDKTAQEIRNIVDAERNDVGHKDADSFVFALFSHGAQGSIYGADAQPVSIDELKKAFDGKCCPDLSGKPKLLIIQACQGNKSTTGVPVADDIEDEDDDISSILTKLKQGDGDEIDAVPWATVGGGDSSTCIVTEDVVHAKADMIVAYSTVEGYKSWRLPDKGSWFIRALVKVFMKHANSEHVAELLTKVRNVVSKRKTTPLSGGLFVQMPACDDTLRKKWYLFPGYNPDSMISGVTQL